MRREKTSRYRILHPDGRMCGCTIPVAFGPFEVAATYRHSTVWLYVRPDEDIYVERPFRRRIPGPAWVLVDACGDMGFVDGLEPSDESTGFRYWKLCTA